MHPPSALRGAAALAVASVACFAVAGAGAWLTSRGLVDWYPALRKPPFNPPDYVFGPVWTALYAMMAVAAWLVWRKAGTGYPLGLFALQLALNLAWTALFFGLRLPGLAFAEILVLWASIAATVVSFWRVSVPAGALLVPYLLWVGFAAVLNLAIWRLNP